MQLQKADGKFVAVPCKFEGYVIIHVIEEKKDEMIVKIVKPEILFEEEKQEKAKKNKKEEKVEKPANPKEYIKQNYGKIPLDDMAEHLSMKKDEFIKLVKQMLSRGEIINDIDNEFIFELYNVQKLQTPSEIVKYLNRHFVGIEFDAMKILRIIRNSVKARNMMHCRECPELKNRGGSTFWCPVRKYKVNPDQFICEKMIGKIGGK